VTEGSSYSLSDDSLNSDVSVNYLLKISVRQQSAISTSADSSYSLLCFGKLCFAQGKIIWQLSGPSQILIAS